MRVMMILMTFALDITHVHVMMFLAVIQMKRIQMQMKRDADAGCL